MSNTYSAYEVANRGRNEEQESRGGSTRRASSLKDVEQKSREEIRRGNRTEHQVRDKPKGDEEGDEHSQDGNDQSLISSLTNKSDVTDTMRTRPISEAVVHLLLCLVQAKDNCLPVWDGLLSRRRVQISQRHQKSPRDISASSLRNDWLGFRSADTLVFNASFENVFCTYLQNRTISPFSTSLQWALLGTNVTF